jgi:hypothetical protein
MAFARAASEPGFAWYVTMTVSGTALGCAPVERGIETASPTIATTVIAE